MDIHDDAHSDCKELILQGYSNGTSVEREQKASTWCQHEFKLNEEIGMVCHICGFVSTEIRDISAPFVSQTQNSTMLIFFYYIHQESPIRPSWLGKF